MHRLYLIVFLAHLTMTAICQIDQDFDNGDLSAWQGDVSDFTINSDFQLQLNASDAGNSTIYTSLGFPDSINWSMDIEMDFSPSNTNKLEIMLAVDNPDLSIANGYILSIGENGSDDAIHFQQLIDGDAATLASGDMGSVASDFNMNFNLSKDSNDEWLLIVESLSDNSRQEELRFRWVPVPAFVDLQFFGFKCTYTSTRVDKFFFDNIIIEEITPDTESPEVSSVTVIAPNVIQVVFNENIDIQSATLLSNYVFNPSISISSIETDANNPTTVNIITSENIPTSTLFELTFQNIEDVAGNVMATSNHEFRIYDTPAVGDLLVNEILFDPFTNEDDFVEVINISDKYLDLKDLVIENADKTETEVIDFQLFLEPQSIVAFSPNPTALIDLYNPPMDANIVEQEIPSFNNSDGNISIKLGDGTVLDAFDYEEDYHLQIIADTEGISLERLSTNSSSNDSQNWTSSSSTNNFATPGYENSAALQNGEPNPESISLEYQTFSPDGDGYKDMLIINYNFDSAGFIGNVSIYDDLGRLEKQLAQNLLIGRQGIIRWDGNSKDNTIAPAGMYIIVYEFFNLDGDVESGKKVCVLGKKLN